VVIATFYRRYEAIFLGILGLMAIFSLWEIAARFHWMDPVLISSPSRVVLALTRWAASGKLFQDVGTSLWELAFAFIAAGIIGIPLGVIMAWNRPTEYALDPFIWGLYSIPLIAFWPLFIIWFGMGSRAIIALAFLISVVQVIVNTVTGVKGIDPLLIRCARSFKASPMDLFFKFILPGALPMILAGLRLAVIRALIGVIVGELFSSNAGLGYHISFSGARLLFDDVFAGLLVLVVVGVGATQFIRAVENRFARWRA
jgi:NitT/TauT family transport system permease protein